MSNVTQTIAKKEENKNENPSILDTFAKFHFDKLSSLLPSKEKVDGANYVYSIDDFPPSSAFEVSTNFPALILPVRRTHELRKKLKSIMLSRPRLSVVVELSDSDLDHSNTNQEDDRNLVLSQENRNMYRKIVLDPQKAGLDSIQKEDGCFHAIKTATMQHDLKALLEKEPQSFRLGSHTIVLNYQDWSAEEILTRLLLPEGINEVPSAFEAVGHLAHVNLRDELIPYKYLVGKVLLEKNSPRIQTVVNKLGSIDNKYRTFGMEIIAGNDNENGRESWSDVLVKEEGCEYRLDFRKVYWNSRLGGEHRRLVKLIRKDASARAQQKESTTDDKCDASNNDGTESPKTSLIVADLMAGIGPFAMPLTARTKEDKSSKNNNPGIERMKGKNKKHMSVKNPPFPIEVHANDLNPSSYEYLLVNAKRNKCDFVTNDDSTCSNDKGNAHRLYAYNMDARAFSHLLQDRGIFPDHCIMNLPATALEFLDAFRGYPATKKSESGERGSSLPRIHVHCFAPKDIHTARQEILKRAETSLGCSLDENNDEVVIHPVRDVAPNKNMYCISFRLPAAASELPRINLIPEHQDHKKEGDGKSKDVAGPDIKRRKTGE